MKKKIYFSLLTGFIISLTLLISQKIELFSSMNLLFVFIATFIVSVPLKRLGVSYGFISYFFALVLLYLFNFDKKYWLIYSFVGIYPIINYFIEFFTLTISGKKVFKFIWFDSIIILIYLLYGNVLNLNVTKNSKIITIFLFMCIQILFYLYNIIFTKIVKLGG